MDELPIACNRDAVDAEETARQLALVERIVDELIERRELDNGYALKLPVQRLRDAAELMEIERRCCGFLNLSLEARASDDHVWLTFSGPRGTKEVLGTELGRILSARNP